MECVEIKGKFSFISYYFVEYIFIHITDSLIHFYFLFSTYMIERMGRNDAFFERYIDDHNYHDCDHIVEIFRHYHPVPLNSSKYINTCWTKLNFLNSTFSHSSDPSYYYTYNQAMTEGVLNSLLAISGVVLNLIVIFVIMRNSGIRKEYLTPSFLSIAISDLMFSSVIIPALCIVSFTEDVPFITGCPSLTYFGFALWLCSALNLVGISVLRCFAVYFSRKLDTRGFMHACRIIPLLGWVISFLVLIPTLAGKFGQFALECKSYRCIMIDINKHCNAIEISPLNCYVLMIIVCGILAFLFNSATFGRIRKHSSKLFKRMKTIDFEIAQNISKKEKSVGKMVIKVTASYAIVYLPVILLRVIEPNAIMKYPWLSSCVNLLHNSLVVIDPLIYILSHEKYQKEVKRMFEMICKSKRSDKEMTSQTNQTYKETNSL